MSGERWDEIARWVDADGRVGLGALASRFGVSEMTIRRDLDALTAAGRLRRVRGGAVSLASSPTSSYSGQPGSSAQPSQGERVVSAAGAPSRPVGASAAPGGATSPVGAAPVGAAPVGAAPPTAGDGGVGESASRGDLRADVGADVRADDRDPVRRDPRDGASDAGGSTSAAEGLPSPGFDLSRAPSSLGSVIASWAGAFPSGFPSTPRVQHSGPTGTPDDHGTPGDLGTSEQRARQGSVAAAPAGYPAAARGSSEAPPGWDLPPTDHLSGHLADHLSDHVPAPTPAPVEDPWVRAAHAALDDLAPGSAVLLTGGTGCLALAHHVARLASRSPATPLTVAVTALAPATVLAGAPGVRLVVLGGEAEHAGTDLVGPSALAALEDLHLDVAVLTPTGLDARGAWAPTSAAAALVAAAVARAERTVVVVAPGALGRPGLVRAAPLGALDQVVAVPAPGEDGATLAARLEAVRAAAPSAPRVSAA